jgi:copper(I)-binding protein
MRSPVYLVVLFLVMTGLAAQCGSASTGQGSGPRITINDAYTPAAMADGNGVIYLTLVNDGDSADTLLKVESQVASAAEMHETKIDENEVMQMSPLAKIEVPAGGSVSLEPGGKHIMLIKLRQALKPDEKISLTLTFEKTGPMTIEAEVREAGSVVEHNMEHDQ